MVLILLRSSFVAQLAISGYTTGIQTPCKKHIHVIKYGEIITKAHAVATHLSDSQQKSSQNHVLNSMSCQKWDEECCHS